MTEPQRTRQTVIGLLLLCFLFYFWELGHIPFYNYEESKEALIVWEMVNGGGWVLPLRNGTEMPLKPPLLHWGGALVALVSGKANEFAVRSPSAFAATAAVFFTFFFARRLWNWRVGLFSALILATSPEWLRWAAYARSDMLFTLFLTAAHLLFFRLWQERATRPRTIRLFYLSVGLATLAKGPLALVLPALVIGGFLAIVGELRFLRRLRPLEGMAIVGVAAVSWYVLAGVQGGWEFFRRQILDENVLRFFESERGGPSRDHAFYYYVPALFVGMLPWSLFFPMLAYFLYRVRAQLRDKKLLYLVVWVVVGLLFFSLASGKRSNYLLPLYPALAMLLGVWWQELMEGSPAFSPVIKRLAYGLALVVCGGLTAAALLLIVHGVGIDLLQGVSPLLHPRDQANLPLVAESLQQQFPVVIVWLSMLLLALGWYFWGLRRRQWLYVFTALTVATSSSLHFTKALFHPLIAQERSYKPFMLGVRSTVKNAPLYFYNGAYDYGAIFYASRHIPVYEGDLARLPVSEDVNEPSYLLIWEDDWPSLMGETDRRLEHLVASEGRGPDKKHKLALIAVLPGTKSVTNGANGTHGGTGLSAAAAPPPGGGAGESPRGQPPR